MPEWKNRKTGFARYLRRNMTKAEVILWQNLRRRQLDGQKFRRQFAIGPYIADFVCVAQRLIIEVDGATHSADHEIARDARRTKYLEKEGWSVYRIWNHDIYDDLSSVLDGILHNLEQRD